MCHRRADDEPVLLDVDELVVRLGVAAEDVVTQARGSASDGRDFPVVIDVIACHQLLRSVEVWAGFRLADADISEHEVRQRAAGVRAVEAERASRSRAPART